MIHVKYPARHCNPTLWPMEHVIRWSCTMIHWICHYWHCLRTRIHETCPAMALFAHCDPWKTTFIVLLVSYGRQKKLMRIKRLSIPCMYPYLQTHLLHNVGPHYVLCGNLKEGLYRIFCGVNRRGDGGVHTLGDASGFVNPAGQLLLTRRGKTRMDGVGIVFEFYIAPL